jgi:phage shock protein PspC (stress-responsive transcriptional regulator)
MFCVNCSFPLEEGDRFCARCGGRTAEGRKLGTAEDHRLVRPSAEKKVAGVCQGVARYFDVDPTLVRIGWVGASLLPFTPGLVAYVTCWALMPREGGAARGKKSKAPLQRAA